VCARTSGNNDREQRSAGACRDPHPSACHTLPHSRRVRGAAGARCPCDAFDDSCGPPRPARCCQTPSLGTRTLRLILSSAAARGTVRCARGRRAVTAKLRGATVALRAVWVLCPCIDRLPPAHSLATSDAPPCAPDNTCGKHWVQGACSEGRPRDSDLSGVDCLRGQQRRRWEQQQRRLQWW
jgi:hypothetical protein